MTAPQPSSLTSEWKWSWRADCRIRRIGVIDRMGKNTTNRLAQHFRKESDRYSTSLSTTNLPLNIVATQYAYLEDRPDYNRLSRMDRWHR